MKLSALDSNVPMPGTPQIQVPKFAPARRSRPRGLSIAFGFWVPVYLLVQLTLALIVTHQSGLLQIVYPVLAFAVGVYLYKRYPVQFLGYAWWIWFLTPEVRRLSDFFKGSFTDFSTIMVAPILVSGLTIFTMLRHSRYLGTRSGLPMVLILLALAYGYVVGIVNGGIAPATFALANWLLPISMALYLAVHWRHYPAMRRCLLRTFTIGTALCGAYGLVQYLVMPPWDAAWMVWSEMTSSMGNPVPFQVRVFGPLNSLAPFTAVIGTGILLATVERNRGRVPAVIFGILSLALSFVRSAWGSAVISFAYQLIFFNNRARLRIVVSTLVIACVTVPVLMSGPIADNLTKRLDTLTNLKDDSSFSDRTSFYSSFLDTAVTNIAGIGLGATGLSSKLSSDPGAQKFESFDSGLMEIPFVLGWPGALLYTVGIVWAMLAGARAARQMKSDRYAVAWFSVALGTVAQLVFGNSLISISGQLALMGMVIPVTALRYAKAQQAAWHNAQRAAQTAGKDTAQSAAQPESDVYAPASADASKGMTARGFE